jgi:hypothetical protein
VISNDVEMPCSSNEDYVSVETPNISEITNQLKKAMLSFVCLLSSKPNVTMSNVQCVVQYMRDLLELLIELLCSNVKEVCCAPDIGRNVEIGKMLDSWRSIPSCFDSVGTKYKFEKSLAELGVLIQPQEVVFGNREDRHNITGTGSSLNFRTDDTMQYIPIGILLHKLTKHQFAPKLCHDRPFNHAEGFIADFRDTETYAHNPVCQKYPDAFLIHLFVDAFETCNELGSHTGVHKLEAMYMCIKNAPSQSQAQLNNIFLVALWYTEDVKKYGYRQILGPVVKDLKQLESDEGMCIEGDVVHGVLILVSADNLGAHSLFGFLESFSAKKFSRLCKVVKGESAYLEKDLVMRTPASYNAAIEMMKYDGYNPSETGIKGSCILNELSAFHLTTNYALDAMHDLLEGIVPFELQCVLPVVLKKGFFSDVQLQSLIVNFNYGTADQNSKPSFTTSSNMRIKAAEAWCLLHCLPVILGSRIPEGDEYWRVITLLCEITGIIFAIF